MKQRVTLEYWEENGWYVGRLKGIPGVFSQGQTLEELETNIREAYTLMLEEEAPAPRTQTQTKDVELEV